MKTALIFILRKCDVKIEKPNFNLELYKVIEISRENVNSCIRKLLIS
jgi:hypothetical protein